MPSRFQRVGGLIRMERALAVLLPEAERLRALNHRLAGAVPRAVARSCQVVAVRDGVAQVYCGNGSAASRLRSLSASAARALDTAEQPVSGLRIRVRADWSRADRPEKKGMGGRALVAWNELDGHLPEGDLKAAVDRLLKRQRGGG